MAQDRSAEGPVSPSEHGGHAVTRHLSGQVGGCRLRGACEKAEGWGWARGVGEGGRALVLGRPWEEKGAHTGGCTAIVQTTLGSLKDLKGLLTGEVAWSLARLRTIAVTLPWGVTPEGAGSGSA